MANKEINYNFKTKNFLILGGSGLIGSALIKKLIKYKAKSITNLDLRKYINSYKFYNYANFDFNKVHNFKKFIEKTFENKKIDVMINALYPRFENWSQSNFNNISYENFSSHMKINSDSFFWSSKIIADKMRKNKSGSIILMNSIYGLRGQYISAYKNTEIKENMTYPIVKGALSNHVRQMASFYGKDNVRINSICSGGIQGLNSMTEKNLSEKFLKNYNIRCPLKRLANTDEVVDVILFLSSNSASYITGINLPVDGGWTAV